MCAVAIGSPQLLMLSAIGLAGQLRGHGIEPLANLPGSGAPPGPPGRDGLLRPAVPLPGSGYNPGEVYASLRGPLAGGWPDVRLFPVLLPSRRPGRPAPSGGFALMASVVAPTAAAHPAFARRGGRPAPRSGTRYAVGGSILAGTPGPGGMSRLSRLRARQH